MENGCGDAAEMVEGETREGEMKEDAGAEVALKLLMEPLSWLHKGAYPRILSIV